MNLQTPLARSADSPAMTLPAAWYRDPVLYQQERDRVFAREWQFVGAQSRLAATGDYIATGFAGYRVFVIRGRDGALRGFHNVCRHRAGPLLAEGAGRCDLLRCRYHGWVYDGEGRLRRTPDFGEAEGFDKGAYGLFPIRVATWRGLVFVNLDRDAGSLEESLGDLIAETAAYPLERCSFVRDETLDDIACNWKTYTDNYVEGYHIPSVHPWLNAAIDSSRFTAEGRGRTVVMRAPQKSGSIYDGAWLWRYPNLTLSAFPDGFNVSRTLPMGHGRTRLVYSFFFADTSPAAMARHEETIARNIAIVREDYAICEQTQANLDAGVYDRGPLSPRHEDGVRYFHAMLRQSIEGERHPPPAPLPNASHASLGADADMPRQ
jgi:choline monooxygenase